MGSPFRSQKEHIESSSVLYKGVLTPSPYTSLPMDGEVGLLRNRNLISLL